MYLNSLIALILWIATAELDSGRVRAVIFKLFRADIQHVNAKYFLSFF